MLLKTLFSGSTGNCTYVCSDKTEILIDAGGSTRRIETALNEMDTSLSNISAIYITHEHTDHVSALPVLLKNFKIPVYTTLESACQICAGKCEQNIHNSIYTIETGNIYETGDIQFAPFRTPHDSLMSVGYKICRSGSDTYYGYATDIGHVTEEMRENLIGCKSVIIESNHDVEMLKNGIYPSYLKKRVLSNNGHLSNDDCAEFLCDLVKNGCESILLAHLSKENNRPKLAYNTSKNKLEESGIKVGNDVVLEVADEKCICALC